MKIQLKNITKSFGRKTVIQATDLAIAPPCQDPLAAKNDLTAHALMMVCV